ncbi:MAG: hypothetical protein ABFR50_04655 [Candidatus Fermentibacteria bacterium]
MSVSLVIIGALLLLCISCDDSPAGLECIEVSYPASGNVWDYMQANTHVEWTGAEGASVRIFLFKNGKYFTSYLDWTPNSGYAARTDYLHPACHGSGFYQIWIEDSNGNTGLGDYFTIMCGGLGDIQITYPSETPTWTYSGDDAYVTWTGSDGELIRVDTYRSDGTYLGTLIDWTPNDGYAQPPYPLDSTLVPGDYYIEIIDDLGRWGIGGDFIIQ